MCVGEGNGLAVKVGNLEGSEVILVSIVLSRESLNKATKLSVLKLLLDARVEAHDILVIISRRIGETTASSCVV